MRLVWRKKTCRYCGARSVIRYGATARGSKRWQCSTCKRTWTERHVGHTRSFVWFKRWINEGYTVTQLVRDSGHSRWKIQQILHWYLDRPPAASAVIKARRLIIDGTYLDRRTGMVVVMNSNGYSVVYGKFGITEGPKGMEYLCQELLKNGCRPHSITIDGSPSVRDALLHHWPSVIIQRCLVHVQRQGLMWCRRYPKTTAAKRLRDIFLGVMNINSLKERDIFLSEVNAWERRFGHSIAATPEKGWVISDLKRARSMLIKAIPNMFHYLSEPDIPRTTNGLEGYFSRLKDRYHDHRGLSPERRASYFKWYFRLRPR